MYHRLLDFIDTLKRFRVSLYYGGIDYFVIHARRFRNVLNFKKIAPILFVLLFVLLIWLFGNSALRFVYSIEWTGFSQSQGNATFKTLWDWLDLLVVPLVLALGAYFLRRAESALSREQSIDDENEKAMIAYVDYIERFLANEEIDEIEAEIANARTEQLFRRLDPERKALVLKFLYDVGLIREGNLA